MSALSQKPAYVWPDRVLNIAHRGARSLAPENTLAALRLAAACGADMWELDVQYSADGRLIVMHDDTLERTTDVSGRPEFENRRPWPVSSFTLEELLTLDAGSWFMATDPFGCIQNGEAAMDDPSIYRHERIPTLESALRLTRALELAVNVEIKDLKGASGDDAIVEDVVNLISDLGMTGRTIVSSFNAGYLRRVKLAEPSLASAFLTEDPVKDPVRLLHDLDADAFHPGFWVTDPDQIALVRQNGFLVNIWTINDKTTAGELVSAGATGLFTDFPQRFRTWF